MDVRGDSLPSEMTSWQYALGSCCRVNNLTKAYFDPKAIAKKLYFTRNGK